MADYIPVAELFARLSLDASELVDGLAEARVKLQDIDPAIISANGLLKELGNQAIATEEEIRALTVSMQEEWESRRAAALAQKVQMAEMAAYEKELRAQRKADIAADLAYEKQLRAEYNTMAKGYADEEAAYTKISLQNQAAERARYTSVWSILLRQQEEAQAATNAAFVNQVSMSPMAIQMAQVQAGAVESEVAVSKLAGSYDAASGKMIVGTMQARTEAQALNEMLGTKIPGSISRIVAFQPQVAAALNSMFDVVLVGAFVDILYHVGEEIYQLTRDMEGFDKASIQAWEDARAGSEKATDALLRYRAAQREVDSAGDKGKTKWDKEGGAAAGDLKDQRDHLLALQAEVKSVAALLQDAKYSKAPFDSNAHIPDFQTEHSEFMKYADALEKITDQGDTIDSLAKRYQHLQEEIAKTSAEIGKLGQTMEKDQNKADRSGVKSSHKSLGPEDHEEPYRLPGYMGDDPAEDFADQVHAQRMSGLPSATRSMFNRGGAGSASMRQTASVAANITIAPQFTFHGVPADIQGFMRDHAEPALTRDIELNARGITKSIVDALRSSGMVVAVG